MGKALAVNAAAYAALLEESARTRWPELFRRDLTLHDRAHLLRLPEGAPFFWCLYRHGTYLVAAVKERIDRTHYAWDFPPICADLSLTETPSRLYVWDGRELKEYPDARSCSEAVRRIALGEPW